MKLNIPRDWAESPIRCKGCGQVLKARGKVGAPEASVPTARAVAAPPAMAKAAAAAVPAAAAEDDEGQSLVAQLRARRRRRLRINMVVAGVLLAAVGIAALVYRQEIGSAVTDFRAAIKKEERPSIASATKEETKPESTKDDRPPRNLAKPPPVVERPTGNGGGSPAEGKPAAPVTTTTSKALPGRALLVGIRNYLYVNPLNPGYRPDNSLTRDPLGLHHLKKVLVDGLRFDESQVVELSDVAAEKPHSPLKATVQATMRVFLEDSRPQDRVVLVFAGHAVEIEDQGYLVPLEGDFTKKEDLIPISWLYEQLEKCKAHRKLLILDVAHLDPEQGLARSGGEKMGQKLEAQLRKVPDGVQVWLSCSGEEHSYEFASSGFIGSVFMHFLQDFARDLGDPKKRREIEKEPGFAEETLPLLYFAPKVNKEVTEYVKNRWNATQTPKLLGVSAKAPDVAADAPAPPPIKVVEPLGSEPLAEAKLIDELVHEIGLNDLGSQSLPPFSAKALEPYQTPADQDPDPEKHPLKMATLDAVKRLQDIEKRFNAEKGVKAEANDAQFKKSIEQKQQQPAKLNQELEEIMEKMEAAEGDREKDTKRWQAHFDYVFTQMLARRIAIMEYNFVLGNKLRKDSPMVMNPQNNGWLIVPHERLQQKDTREWEKKRQEILDRIIKEHPGTPWEIIARRDKSTYLGLTIQEAKVD
jgi:hypothetical protein